MQQPEDKMNLNGRTDLWSKADRQTAEKRERGGGGSEVCRHRQILIPSLLDPCLNSEPAK